MTDLAPGDPSKYFEIILFVRDKPRYTNTEIYNTIYNNRDIQNVSPRGLTRFRKFYLLLANVLALTAL